MLANLPKMLANELTDTCLKLSIGQWLPQKGQVRAVSVLVFRCKDGVNDQKTKREQNMEYLIISERM